MAKFAILYEYGDNRTMTDRVDAYEVKVIEGRVLSLLNANGQIIKLYNTWIKVDRA